MVSEGRERQELKEVARKVVRKKIMSEITEPLSELEEKRAKLKRLRAKVDELKEVTGKLTGER